MRNQGAWLMIANYHPKTMEEKSTHLGSLVSIPSISPIKFEDTTKFKRLDFVTHQRFGLGFVEEIISDGSTVKNGDIVFYVPVFIGCNCSGLF